MYGKRPERKYIKGWSFHVGQFIELGKERVKENFCIILGLKSSQQESINLEFSVIQIILNHLSDF